MWNSWCYWEAANSQNNIPKQQQLLHYSKTTKQNKHYSKTTKQNNYFKSFDYEQFIFNRDPSSHLQVPPPRRLIKWSFSSSWIPLDSKRHKPVVIMVAANLSLRNFAFSRGHDKVFHSSNGESGSQYNFRRDTPSLPLHLSFRHCQHTFLNLHRKPRFASVCHCFHYNSIDGASTVSRTRRLQTSMLLIEFEPPGSPYTCNFRLETVAHIHILSK